MKRKIGVGRFHDGLYIFNNQLHSSHVASASISFDLWHLRLGHPSLKRLSLFSKDVISFVKNKNHICDICPRAKQCRLSFSSNEIKSENIFDMIHCDV